MDNLLDWQNGLDHVAYFNLLGLVDPAHASEPERRGGRLTGVLIRGQGHRLDVGTLKATGGEGFHAVNTVGTEASAFRFGCSAIPEDFWFTGKGPIPATAFEPTKSQRIAIHDAFFSFGEDGRHSVRGLGSGRTYPIQQNGKDVYRLAANGLLTGGTGDLANRQGMFVLTGLYTPPGDFQLRISVMVVDPTGLLTTEPVPAIEAVKGLPRDVTYLDTSTFHPSVTATEIVPGPTPESPPASLTCREKLRLCESRFSALGPEGLRCNYEIGEPSGEHRIALQFSSLSGTGAPESPSGAYGVEEFEVYHDGSRRGTLKIALDEIRAVLVPIPGVPADMQTQMFAGFGPVVGGSGAFAGAQGFQINMGVGTFVPHLLSILYQFELADPTGRFRA